MYQSIALDFNNEDLCVALLAEAEDLDDFELLEPNDMLQISILCYFEINSICYYIIIITIILTFHFILSIQGSGLKLYTKLR